MKFRMLAVTAALVASAGAQAAPVWSDNFDANALATNSVPAGWYIGNAGTVDVIGAPAFFDLLPGNGRYIDLDGSNNLAGKLTTDLTLAAGTYTVTFDLAGNQRDGTTDPVSVMFGTTSGSYSLAPSAGFSSHSLTFTTDGSTFSLSFLDGRDGNVGALLDNVSISAVPEAGNLSMMLAGIAALGFAARRRRG